MKLLISFVKDINANYPMGFSGIDWDKKKPLVFINFNSPNVLSDKINSEFSNIFTSFPELLNEKAIYIGDDLTELGYEIWIKDFIQFKEFFLSIPQHIYLWFPTIQKCINITFEDELLLTKNDPFVFAQPIKVVEAEGKTFILNGHHRIEAAIKIGYKGKIPYQKIPASQISIRDLII
ncbi:hypothetical protein [uncultured Chryseobacterium sp.]|uniref:hypothetical protein n=1 Tax=uncultured Chryseobacterium sp. TaxID=259322 RepID=UPI0025E8901A|nr:hypothetical protein [uncultured Chryseobacterium sp.]